jgi:hypothetical protein
MGGPNSNSTADMVNPGTPNLSSALQANALRITGNDVTS